MAAVQCPTLFVIGAHDQMTPPKSARALAKLARQPGIAEVNAGHSMMTEAPGPVLDALRAFLAR
jgi:pimeloyl-ACP methyl ester carboxylesterase